MFQALVRFPLSRRRAQRLLSGFVLGMTYVIVLDEPHPNRKGTIPDRGGGCKGFVPDSDGAFNTDHKELCRNWLWR